MLKNRLQVLATSLCALAVIFGARLAVAQPAPALEGGGFDAPFQQRPAVRPLLPLSVEDWLAAHGGPLTLKLKMQDATAIEIVDEIRRQSGIEITPAPDMMGDGVAEAPGAQEKLPRFSIEADGHNFWQTARNWSRGQGLLGVRRDRDAPGELVLQLQSPRGIGFPVGPCLLVATGAQNNRRRVLDFQEPGVALNQPAPIEDGSLLLLLQVLIDPRLAPSLGGVILEVEAASDDAGRPMPVQNGDSISFSGALDDFSGTIDFRPPLQDSRRISKLSGVLRLAVISKSQKWEVELAKAPNSEHTFNFEGGSVTLRVDGLTERHGSWSAKLRQTRKTQGPERLFSGKYGPMPFGTAALMRAITFLDGRGQRMRNDGFYGSGAGGEGTTELTYSFSRGSRPMQAAALGAEGEPAKLVVDVPLEWREVQIPFELKDLPLP